MRLLPYLVSVALALARVPFAHAADAGGSVDCTTPTGGVATAICGDTALTILDRRLVEVYTAATKAATPEQRNRLFAEQQSWLDDRRRCTGAQAKTDCMKDLYVRRIADLQGTFQLVKSRGPFRFACGKGADDYLTAQYFDTEPPSARFFHDGRTVTAFVARSGSGARYENANVSFWEHQGEASVVWYGRSFTCATRPAK
jgi:uncharacterized protein